MNNSIHRRLKAIEKNAGRGDEIVTLTFANGTTCTLTADKLTQAIRSAQGTGLKPVPIGDESIESEAY